MEKDKGILVTADKLPEFFPGLSVKTLAILRSQKKGPSYYKRGRRVFYDTDEVRRWLTECPVGREDSAQKRNGKR